MGIWGWLLMGLLVMLGCVIVWLTCRIFTMGYEFDDEDMEDSDDD